MSTVSENPPSRAAHSHERPSVAQQRATMLSAHAADSAAVATQWEVVADLLDEFVGDYDARLGRSGDRAAAQFHEQLQQVLDCFDLMGAAARTNSDVLDDLASEIILAQARMSTIWSDYRDEQSESNELSTRHIERRYAARAAREVWYPFDGAAEAAARRLRAAPQVYDGGDAESTRDVGQVLPLIR